jgi:hypothetical protein
MPLAVRRLVIPDAAVRCPFVRAHLVAVVISG